LQHCRIFRTAHFNHHPASKAINMSANCATWTSERIELLKRCLHAGLSCGQIAREIGVTRNAVIGKMNRLGLSRPKDWRGCTLFELSQGKCRWPISNPGAEDFCFCGNEPVKGLPYCLGHARIAYRSVGGAAARVRER
jgi:GcrA cell cycle regulator